MPKTEFQLEEEIKGELWKSKQESSLVKDAFDSIFRVGKIEVSAPISEIKKTKFKAIKYHDSNMERRKKYDELKDSKTKQDNTKEELR